MYKHTTLLFCFHFFVLTMISFDVVMAVSANTLPFLQEERDVWTFSTVQGGGVGEAPPEVECKYLAYFLNKRLNSATGIPAELPR